MFGAKSYFIHTRAFSIQLGFLQLPVEALPAVAPPRSTLHPARVHDDHDVSRISGDTNSYSHTGQVPMVSLAGHIFFLKKKKKKEKEKKKSFAARLF